MRPTAKNRREYRRGPGGCQGEIGSRFCLHRQQRSIGGDTRLVAFEGLEAIFFCEGLRQRPACDARGRFRKAKDPGAGRWRSSSRTAGELSDRHRAMSRTAPDSSSVPPKERATACLSSSSGPSRKRFVPSGKIPFSLPVQPFTSPRTAR